MNPRHVSSLAHRLHLVSRPRSPTAVALFKSAAAATATATATTTVKQARRHSKQQCRLLASSVSTRNSHPSRTRPSAVHDSRSPTSNWARSSPQLAKLVAAASLVSLAVILSLSASPRASFIVETPTPPASASTASAPSTTADARDPGPPRFRIQEVRKHGPDSETPWIIHGDKVYDITDWVPAHPGGQVILRAAGGSIEPYWNIFAIHKNQYVYEILSQYFIGYVDQADLVDGKPAQEQIEDPFADDPQRHPSLITKTSKPCNAETPCDALGHHFITPNELFYVRNHMWVPNVGQAASSAHVLTVELLDGSVKQYTLQDLKARFPSRTITATLQCSGNRRKHMGQGSGRLANGLQWTAGAISNATWEGVLLSDVLADAGFDIGEGLRGSSAAKHVHFSGLEAYGASIPLRKAIDPQGDVLLAYSMNDTPLPPDHGFPLRAIVPGHVAARSVKWLSQITLSEEESTSQWQRRDYKCFGPNETRVDWDAAPAIQEMPVQSAVTGVKMRGWTTQAGAEQSEGDSRRAEEAAQLVSLSGYAFSGGGRSIVRVDLSLDGGRSWTQAQLLPDRASEDGRPSPAQEHGTWTWKRWRYDGAVPLGAFRERKQRKDYPADAKSDATTDEEGNEGGDANRRCTTVLVKATDEAYNTQPESHAATWNLRGNLATAWHRIQICADCSASATMTPQDAETRARGMMAGTRRSGGAVSPQLT